MKNWVFISLFLASNSILASDYWWQKTPLIHMAISCHHLNDVKRFLKEDRKNLEIVNEDNVSPLMYALRLSSFAHGTDGQRILEEIALKLWEKGANIDAVLMKEGQAISLLEYASNDYFQYRDYLVRFFERNNIPIRKDNLAYYRKYYPRYAPPEEPVGPGQ